MNNESFPWTIVLIGLVIVSFLWLVILKNECNEKSCMVGKSPMIVNQECICVEKAK